MDTVDIGPSGNDKKDPRPVSAPPLDPFCTVIGTASNPGGRPLPEKDTATPDSVQSPKTDPLRASGEKEPAPTPPTDAFASLALPPATDDADERSPAPLSDRNSADRTAPAPNATGSFRPSSDASRIASKPLPPPPAGTKFPAVEGYELLGVLGRGGMGVVYKARHIELKRLVALKMILGGAHAGDEDMQRFRTEAEAVARLQHPHIVQIHEIGSQDGQPFFSLEFVDGGSLDRKISGKPQPVLEAASLIETLAEAMHFAHEHGVIHRDLKPANILLTKSGQPKITDFGLAKQTDSAHGQTETGSVMGTPSYMPPEQAQGDTRNLGAAADIYSLGAILYELLTGKPPFYGETAMDTLIQVQTEEPKRPSRLRPRLPRDVETICLKCLEKTPARRYATAAALADDLRRFLNCEPILARPTRAWERGVKWVRRRPAVAACLGLLVLSAAGALAAFGLHEAQQQHRHASARKRIDEQLLRAREAEKNEAWAGARDLLLSAAEESRDEPGLAEESSAIQEDLERVQRRLQALTRLKEFAEFRDEAIFHATLAGGETGEGSAVQTRAAALKALDAVGLKLPLESAWEPDGALTAEEQAEVRRGCYDLLLTLADVVAHRPVNAGDVARREGALEGLKILAAAERLGFDTRAYHLRRHRFLANAGNVPAARQETERARQCPARTARDHYLVGEEYYRRGDVTEARAEFEEALRVEGDGFWAGYYLALCHVKLGQPRLAVEPLSHCLARKQGLAWIYLLRGFVYGQLANYPAAEADFSEVLARAPSAEVLYVLYNNRAVMRVGQKNFDEARNDLQQAIKLKPNQYQAYASLGQVEFLQGRSEEAVARMDEAVKAARRLVASGAIDEKMLGLLYRTRSRFQLGRDDVEAALADIDKALAIEYLITPATAALHAERGRLLHRLQRYADAIGAYAAALEASRSNPEVPHGPPDIHRWKAEALFSAQRYADAIAALQEYVHEGGVLAVKDYQLLALAHHKTGDLRATIDDLTKILEVDPNNREVLAQRGQVYLVVRAYTLAVRDFDRALALSPEEASLYEGRGFAQAKLGQHQQASVDAEAAWRRGTHTTQQAYRAARTLAQAAGHVDTERAAPNSPAAKTRRSYEERSLALLREGLLKLPENQRYAFWRHTVRNDPELNPLHRTAGYAELERTYLNSANPR